MANIIALAIGQYNGSYTVTGDIAVTGYYSVAQGAVLAAFSGEVTDLGKFSASLDDSTMKYKLEPAAADKAKALMDAVSAIETLLEARFAVEAPVISGDTLFGTTTQVSISIPADSKVYYTTDGSTPTSGSSEYSEPFTLSDSATVKAIAIKDGVSSEVASEAFVKLAAPEISGDTPFDESTTATITGPEGATLHYTTNGDTPTAESSTYSEALSLEATTTVKAIAVKDGVSSAVTSKTFTKN